jgi:HAD superfamily hydrolase (TIGR01509 family)
MSTFTKSPGFLIDMDGLLINSESLSKIAFEKMCSQFGCNFTQDYHSKIRGMKWQVWTRSFIDTFNLDLKPEIVMAKHTDLLLHELDQSVQLMPGALALLDWIESRTYPKALVTSSNSDYATRYLARLGILGRFNELITAEDVKSGKPDPEPYILGASKISRKPSDCFVFEDSVNGALSGKAAGSIVFGVPNNDSDRTDMTSADYLLVSLVDSIVILENLGL